MSEALLPPSPDDVPVNKHPRPRSVEAERSVWGGLMLDNQRLDAVREVLGEEDFYRDDHRQIFRMMCELGEASEPLDVITLSDELHRHDQLERVRSEERRVGKGRR